MTVHADAAGVPVAVQWGGRHVGVSAVQDCWRIDEEWWQQEITRRYFLLHLADGRLLTVFHDLVGGGWFRQTYT
jgi:hypothetical protein